MPILDEPDRRPLTTKTERIARRADSLLATGLLASELPARLMAEFDLTPGQARRAAQAAIKRSQTNE